MKRRTFLGAVPASAVGTAGCLDSAENPSGTEPVGTEPESESADDSTEEQTAEEASEERPTPDAAAVAFLEAVDGNEYGAVAEALHPDGRSFRR